LSQAVLAETDLLQLPSCGCRAVIMKETCHVGKSVKRDRSSARPGSAGRDGAGPRIGIAVIQDRNRAAVCVVRIGICSTLYLKRPPTRVVRSSALRCGSLRQKNWRNRTHGGDSSADALPATWTLYLWRPRPRLTKVSQDEAESRGALPRADGTHRSVNETIDSSV
jgi:hypothetical protein